MGGGGDGWFVRTVWLVRRVAGGWWMGGGDYQDHLQCWNPLRLAQ